MWVNTSFNVTSGTPAKGIPWSFDPKLIDILVYPLPRLPVDLRPLIEPL